MNEIHEFCDAGRDRFEMINAFVDILLLGVSISSPALRIQVSDTVEHDLLVNTIDCTLT